jgi:hypothetical protein
MRTFLLTVAALALILIASPAPSLAAPDVKKLVSDYITPHMPDKRRVDIVKELKTVSPATMTAQLKKAIGEDAQRQYALQLAIEFQVPGLFATAKKFYDSSDRERIIAYSLLTLEKGSDKFLAERWAAADTDSEEFQLLQSAFGANGVTVETINTFHDAAQNETLPEARRRAAFDIVVYQCGADAKDMKELAEQWPEINKKLRQISPPAVAGVNILRRKAWARSGCRQWGPGLRLTIGAEANCTRNPPPGLDAGKYTVTAHFWIEEKDTVMRFALQGVTAEGFPGYMMHIDNGKFWIETAEMNMAETEVTTGKWIQFAWQVTQPHPKPTVGDLQLAVSLDGRKLATLDGRSSPGRVFFDVSQGSVVLGAVDYVRN